MEPVMIVKEECTHGILLQQSSLNLTYREFISVSQEHSAVNLDKRGTSMWTEWIWRMEQMWSDEYDELREMLTIEYGV